MISKSEKNKYVLRCALIAFLSALIPVAFLAVKNGGFVSFGYDYLNQEIPFNMAMNGLKLSDLGGWTWNLDLGASTIQGFSFYCLGSPFFWLSRLLPEAVIPYALPWILVLKYTLAAVLAFLYIRLFVKKPEAAIAAALLYAFSGFQATNLLYYHFHDVVAFFPLLPLGIEKTAENPKNRWLFAFAVCINALVNYYFFVIEAVFMLLYMLFRRKCSGSLLLGGLLGVGMSAVLLLPNALYLLGNQRSGMDALHLRMQIKDWLFMAKAFLLPGEAMNSESCIYYEQYDSIACWLPMVGMSLSTAYVLKKRDWLSWFLVALTVAAFVPALSAGFLLFTEDTKRWLFIPVLMGALASGLVLQNAGEYPVKKGILVNAALILVFYALVNVLPHDGFIGYGIRAKRLLMLVLVSLAGLALTWLMAENAQKMLASVAVFAVLTTGITAFIYDSFAENPEEYLNNYALGMSLEPEDVQRRQNISNNEITLPGKEMGIASFSSTLSNATYEFCSLFGYEYRNDTRFKDSVEGLPELLTAPIGFTVNGCISADELNGDAKKLFTYAVVEEDDRAKAADYSGFEAGLTVKDFIRSSRGFSCSSDFEKTSLVYFSVPYDNGWKAFVDGEERVIIDSGGMMLLGLEAGNHSIEFRYSTPGYRAGLVISAICFAAFIGLVTYDSKRNRSDAERGK